MATVYSSQSETYAAETSYRPIDRAYDQEPYEYGGQPELVRDTKRG